MFEIGENKPPFWETKSLQQMSRSEWEALCDGCGRCCLVKLIDDETEELHYTMASCRLLDTKSCQCSDYAKRAELIKDCISLNPDNLSEMNWLPPTCAYKRLAEGRTLSWWHPLISGDVETVHEAGISVRGKCISETHMHEDDLWGARVLWPLLDEESGE
ncbi:MAG: YcgN family cysteine cluster protein [Hyphomicrobiales bacterium]